jgi:hypothetical protein
LFCRYAFEQIFNLSGDSPFEKIRTNRYAFDRSRKLYKRFKSEKFHILHINMLKLKLFCSTETFCHLFLRK